ncbi:cupin domain-containing protein [Longispora urticae]
MRQFISDSAESSAVGVVDVARWEQYGLDGTMPFQAMWYTIPPGGSGPQDGHPELELSIVVTGVATVETGDRITEVPVGSAFLLDSEEPHVIRNLGPEPLVVFSAYWMPLTTGQPGATVEEKAL